MSSLSEAIVADGRTHMQLAIAANVSQATISRIVSGDTRWPRHTTIFPLAKVLRMRLSLTPDNE